ncbi:uncharacterized protein [Hetaerina americana]|uniref:uncharacterized protein n=1 Tax=Hetaerina americana TaxID=62018 RepID=UPI003A7F3653
MPSAGTEVQLQDELRGIVENWVDIFPPSSKERVPTRRKIYGERSRSLPGRFEAMKKFKSAACQTESSGDDAETASEPPRKAPPVTAVAESQTERRQPEVLTGGERKVEEAGEWQVARRRRRRARRRPANVENERPAAAADSRLSAAPPKRDLLARATGAPASACPSSKTTGPSQREPTKGKPPKRSKVGPSQGKRHASGKSQRAQLGATSAGGTFEMVPRDAASARPPPTTTRIRGTPWGAPGGMDPPAEGPERRSANGPSGISSGDAQPLSSPILSEPEPISPHASLPLRQPSPNPLPDHVPEPPPVHVLLGETPMRPPPANRRTGIARVQDRRVLVSPPREVIASYTVPPPPPALEDRPEKQLGWLIQLGVLDDSDDGHFESLVQEITEEAASLIGRNRRGGRQNRSELSRAADVDITFLYRTNKGGAFRRVCGESDARCCLGAETVAQHLSKAAPEISDAPAPSTIPPINIQPQPGEERDLLRGITAAEVCGRLSRAKDTAPGPDGIPYKSWRSIDPDGMLLAAIFNRCFQVTRVPASWKHSRIVLLHKGGEKGDIGNWRPIALSPTIAKVFTGILADRISAWAYKGKRLSFPYQKGFVPATEGCFEHNFIAQAAIDTAKGKGTEIALAWLDLADAFGSIPHPHIIRVLAEMGMPKQLLDLISDLYTGATASVVVERGESEPFPIRCGVGPRPASPRRLSPRPTSVCLLAYADDLLLVARDSGSLRALLHIVKQSADWCGLRFNAKKCASLHLDFRGGRQGVRDTAFSIQGGDQLGDLLAKLRKDLDSVGSSELAPWQKIDALHTFLLPRLHFPLRVTATTKKSLARTDTVVYGAVKEWLYLPQRASREIIHLPSHLGGGGYTPLPVLKDCLVVTQAFRMLTCKDPFVRKTAWYSLQEAVHQRLGKIGAPPEKRVLCGYLSGDAEITAGSTAGATASLWSRARRATRDLQRLCGLRWEWSVFRHDISLRLSNPTPTRRPSSSPRHPATERAA